jgi:tRNA-dihydrouridine synthase
LANGGINTPEDALEILKKYPSLDGLGIARGAWGKPYLFQQIKEITKNGNYIEYDFKAIKKIMLRHAKLIWQDKKEVGMFEIRKHLAWYIRGFPGAADLRRELVQAKSVAEIKKILQNKT